jgi:UDP-N-acetylglucosamine 2-epimerase (non-hydrolysing)
VRLLYVVGARPNFMKVAPVLKAVAARGFAEQVLVHTGQHYDAAMSDVFFRDLGMPAPDVFLGVGSGTQAEQTGRVMLAFEPVVAERRPDLVVVAGDVNSTMAAAIVAAKAVVPVAHIEAGLRSFDPGMPEEVNRIVTDRLSELLLTPSPDGDENLRREGVPAERIVRVGNAMIDSLVAARPLARARPVLAELGLAPRGYVLVTLHRPSNVDEPATLAALLGALGEVARRLPVIFPVHPRTRARIGAAPELAALAAAPGLRLLEPQGYLDFLALLDGARLALTDSGGVQEETTALGVPCLTLRENTERPITISEGTNQLIGRDPRRIVAAASAVLDGDVRPGRVPALWDGRAGERIADAFAAWAARRPAA